MGKRTRAAALAAGSLARRKALDGRGEPVVVSTLQQVVSPVAWQSAVAASKSARELRHCAGGGQAQGRSRRQTSTQDRRSRFAYASVPGGCPLCPVEKRPSSQLGGAANGARTQSCEVAPVV
jgi:hypothetical protein